MTDNLRYRNTSRRKHDPYKGITAPEMVDRIARVLAEGTDDWRPWRHIAKRAIAAMKNPTPQMRDAFLRNAETGATPSDEDSVEFTLNFNAAIDAALKETP